MTCYAKSCEHVFYIQEKIKQNLNMSRSSDKIAVVDQTFSYLANCDCPLLFKNKKFMETVQNKLNEFYKDDLKRIEELNVDWCPYSIKMFGCHIQNCNCKQTRSGKKY